MKPRREKNSENDERGVAQHDDDGERWGQP